jgi:hypothetical protein
MDNNLSQSIDMIYVDAGIAGAISGSTTNSGFYTSSLGLIPYTSTDGIELYNGEFGGTVITATTQTSIGDQTEVSSIQFNGTGSTYTTYSLNYLYQNISSSVRSQRFLDLDYTSDQLTPINLGLITQSINNALTDNYNTYTNPNNPYAQLQDTNYRLNSFTIPRYYGSKTISAKYTDYTQGDESYGSTAAIDKIKFQYAYLVDMYSSSFQLPGRVNAQIKYIFSNDQNVLNLTKTNENIFTVQNVYKSGETVDISLFDYDPTAQDVQFLTNNQNLSLFEGGFRYSPILYKSGSTGALTYLFKDPFAVQQDVQTPANNNYFTPDSNNSIDKFSISSNLVPPGVQFSYNITISYDFTTTTQNVRIGLRRPVTSAGINLGYSDQILFVEYNAGTSFSIPTLTQVMPGDPSLFLAPELFDVSAFTSGGTVTSKETIFFNSVSESASNARWYAINNTTLRISPAQSQYYGSLTFGGPFIPGLETPVFPLSFEKGDMLRFFNSSSRTFGREDEFRVVSAYQEQEAGVTYYYVTLDRGLSLNNIDNPASTGFPSFISNYIALKHIPDETNLILDYTSSANILQDGLIFPQYINPLVRRNSGNIVKALKQQNLI